MKRALFLLIINCFFSAVLLSQEKQLEVKVNYNHNTSGVTADIEVVVLSGEPDFTFYLMTNDPVNGKVLIKSKPVKKNIYTFKEVEPGWYFIKIVDSAGILSGKTIIVNETEI